MKRAEPSEGKVKARKAALWEHRVSDAKGRAGPTFTR